MPALTSSGQPRRQHKALGNAPWHVRRRLLTAPLSKELQRQFGVKRVPVRVGDTVLILRGDFKGAGVLRDAPHVDLPPLPWRRQVGGTC